MPRPSTFTVRGSVSSATHLPRTSQLAIHGARRVELSLSRDAATLGSTPVDSDELVRVELENGFVYWSRADDLLRERGRLVVSRSTGEQEWQIDALPTPATAPTSRLPQATASRGERGALGIAIKALEFFGIDLKGMLARDLGLALENKQLGTAPGVYRIALNAAFSLQAVEADLPPAQAGQPLLVLLHGTASSTRGSFKDLWPDDKTSNGVPDDKHPLTQLHKRYGSQVYGFQHRSLTESPIRNALDLARRLPAGAELHLLSHSRGGLVGELLCLGQRNLAADPLGPATLNLAFAADRTVAEQLGLPPLDDQALQARDAGYQADRQLLSELLDELKAKQFKVRRFVRVACPARGTTLASGRLDRWLSMLSMLADYAGNDLAQDIVDFMLAVVKQRTDPRTLPGLEAMMPGAALNRLLHHPDLSTGADLTVIAGDIEPGEGLFARIKVAAVDWFYGSDHDLVVNTGSMTGGIRRAAADARYLRDQGSDVSHFNYFKNKKSVSWLMSGLLRADGSDAGFMRIADAPAADQAEPRWRSALRASRSSTTPRPLALVLPGIMGSAVAVRKREIWLSYMALLRGGLADIGWDAQDVEATDVLGSFYGPLIEHLAISHKVELFPYDWRQSIITTATQLTDKLLNLLPEVERSGQPVHLVAHSMGGLVVRAMMADGGAGAQVWRRITALPNSRLLMLGTPNHGSYEAVRWLTGSNPTQRKIALLDFSHSINEIIDIVHAFPGMAELLPFDGRHSFGQASFWKDLRQNTNSSWNPIDEAVLRTANATWDRLKRSEQDSACLSHMIYVTGSQKVTVADFELLDQEESSIVTGVKKLGFIGTGEGDGTVTWESGRLPGVPMYFVADTAHDDLCSKNQDRRSFSAFVELLNSGRTDLLASVPPATRSGGAAHNFPIPPLPFADTLPQERELVTFGLGQGRPEQPDDAASTVFTASISVRVVHGDLAYATHPVLVGHYIGDTIVSAEAALDQRLGHALSRRLELGLYPGPVGTHAVFFNTAPKGKPAGALVVGLGQVGDIAPSRLQASVRDVLLEHAVQSLQRVAARSTAGQTGTHLSLGISSLLVGTSAGGMKVRDSVQAILRGALAANAKLVEAGLDNQVLIDQVDLLEVYEDVAISAAAAVTDLLSDAALGACVHWPEGTVADGEGRQRRSHFDDGSGWWQRLEIIQDKQRDCLRFIATTDRARAEETLSAGQLELAEGFIAQAGSSSATDSEVAKTLFEMLLPNSLKESAPDQRDLVLTLDEASASYPWELLENRWSINGRPPAVANGMLRQLKTQEFRARPIHALDRSILVVGNPDLQGAKGFPDLPGARLEAQSVNRLFEAEGYSTLPCIDECSDGILNSLHQRAWRVLHLAGHGVLEFPAQTRTAAPCPACGVAAAPQPRTVSGMVIGGNVILTPGDVEQLRHVPELVFVNCCHLGKTDASGRDDYAKLAANLGVQFIRMGVKAVIAAGWAVDDGAARHFAETFYRRMLQGERFGQAVRQAREATWLAYPSANTWGAYQCYGDPDFRLVRDSGGLSRRALPPYSMHGELVIDLKNLAETTRMQSREGQQDDGLSAQLQQRVDELLQRVPEKMRSTWIKRADVAASLGFAWGEAGNFARAVEWLDAALKSDVGDCPMRAIEQRANFRCRLAAQQWEVLRRQNKGQGVDPAAAAELASIIEHEIAELQRVADRSPTQERWNLLGSAYKRLAWVRLASAPSACLDALRDSCKNYESAWNLELDIKGQSGQPPAPYALFNWATVQLLVDLYVQDTVAEVWNRKLLPLCTAQIQTLTADDDRATDFWLSVAAADGHLALLLASGGADSAATANIIDIYRRALQRGASPRQQSSVLEHLDFLVALTGSIHPDLGPLLTTIRNAL